MSIFRPKREQVGGYRRSPPVTIRWATSSDAEALRILAELDEVPLPAAPVLLAFVGDELWAGVSLSTGALIADPFRPSAEVSVLLLERGRQLTVPERLQLGFGLPRSHRRAAPADAGNATRLSRQASPGAR